MQLVRYLGISDGNMQEGSFRCDANISIKPKRAGRTRHACTELKNLNSFRFIEKSDQLRESSGRSRCIEDGGEVVQETRLYDSA